MKPPVDPLTQQAISRLQVADADSILYPVWQSGAENHKRLASVLATGLATVVQGGNPSVRDAASFRGSSASLDDILEPIDELLLNRHSSSGPSIFICRWTSRAPQWHRCSESARE